MVLACTGPSGCRARHGFSGARQSSAACGAGCSGERERDGGPAAAAHPAPGLHLHRGRVQHVPLLLRPAGQALLRKHRSVLSYLGILKFECPVTHKKVRKLKDKVTFGSLLVVGSDEQKHDLEGACECFRAVFVAISSQVCLRQNPPI